MIEVRHYATESGRDVVSEWLVDLGDIRARAKVSVRIARLEAGNFGDWKNSCAAAVRRRQANAID
jgi:putative component of toxin-antitoxin plasmid stabilization module